jgi:hypothetical protein
MYGELVHLVLRETLEDHGDLAASDPCDTHARTHKERERVRARRERRAQCFKNTIHEAHHYMPEVFSAFFHIST